MRTANKLQTFFAERTRMQYPRERGDRPWWLPTVGIFGIAALFILVPVTVGLLAVMGAFMWALTKEGPFGWFIDAWMAISLLAIILATFRHLRS